MMPPIKLIRRMKNPSPEARMTLFGSPHRLKPVLLLSILCGLCFLIFVTNNASASGDQPPEGQPPAATNEPNPMGPLSPRLNKPILPASPSMADRGALPYWGICLSCHGDKGQGLTDEWRQGGFGLDMNCWKSKCHAPNHPTPGFVLPRLIPAIIGPNTLQRFTTAQELKTYIKNTMPWWNPGSLSEDDSWNLTAYLLRENGVLPHDQNLNIQQASITPVHVPIRERGNEFDFQFALASVLGMASLVLIGLRFLDRQHPAAVGAGPIWKIPISSVWKVPKSSVKRPNFFLHLHPPTIPMPQARWRYTLGAGGLAVFLTIVIALTGLLEMFFYIPTPAQAGNSIQMITFLIPFGGLVRGLHFWAAQALVVVAGIHMLRVIFTGSYHPPRRFNFVLGVGLFVLVLLLDFTGYILRWDDGIHWALIVGTNLLNTIPVIGEQIYRFVVGGQTPGLATLTRFYAWHIMGLTLAIIILLGWHIFRVRRDGGISAPEPGLRTSSERISRVELLRREVLAMLVTGAALVLIATLIPAPLAAPILDASMPLNPDVRAPWFFLWVQQLLRYGSAFWMGIVIPIAVLLLLASLPYLPIRSAEDRSGHWFPRAGRWVQILSGTLALAWLILTIMELKK